jgi:hypothetical protein
MSALECFFKGTGATFASRSEISEPSSSEEPAGAPPQQAQQPVEAEAAEEDQKTPHIVTFNTNKKPRKAVKQQQQQQQQEDAPYGRTRTGKVRKRPIRKRQKTDDDYHGAGESVLSRYATILRGDDFIAPEEPEPTLGSLSSISPFSAVRTTVSESSSDPELKRKDQQQQRMELKRNQLSYFRIHLHMAQNTDAEKYQEWVKIQNLSEKDLDFALHQIQCQDNQSVTEQIAMVLKDSAGFIIDKVSRGEGKVQEKIEQDEHLKQAIGKKVTQHVGLIGLNAQIGLLLAADTIQGKKEQYKQQKSVPVPTTASTTTGAQENKAN